MEDAIFHDGFGDGVAGTCDVVVASALTDVEFEDFELIVSGVVFDIHIGESNEFQGF